MSNLMERARSWLSDPFNKRPVLQRHTEILREMTETKTIAKETLAYYDNFPISRMVGNQRLRGKDHAISTSHNAQG